MPEIECLEPNDDVYFEEARRLLSTGDFSLALRKVQEFGDHKDKKFLTELENVKNASKAYDDCKKSYDNKDYRAALYYVNKALVSATQCDRLKVLKAECLTYLKRYSESQDILTKIYRDDPSNPDIYFLKGLMLYYQDNTEKAFNHFTQALKLCPDHAKAHGALKRAKNLKNKKDEGNAAYKSNKLDEALKLYTEALTIDPFNSKTNAKLYFNRALIYAKVSYLSLSNNLTFNLEILLISSHRKTN